MVKGSGFGLGLRGLYCNENIGLLNVYIGRCGVMRQHVLGHVSSESAESAVLGHVSSESAEWRQMHGQYRSKPKMKDEGARVTLVNK